MNSPIRKARFERCAIITKHKHNGTPFQLFEFFVTILSDSPEKGLEMRGTMQVQRAQRYFTYCGIKTRDLVGKTVQVTIGTREYNTPQGRCAVNEIEYINVLKPNGLPIIML